MQKGIPNTDLPLIPDPTTFSPVSKDNTVLSLPVSLSHPKKETKNGEKNLSERKNNKLWRPIYQFLYNVLISIMGLEI